MGKRKAQQEFQGGAFKKQSDSFGGAKQKGNPKGRRPLDSKLPIHLTLRADKSVLRLPKNFGVVEDNVYRIARKHGLRVYRFANVGNHLHLAIKISRIWRWSAFIRDLTGTLALKCKTGWKFRPHTRIVRGWKKAYRIVTDYIDLNNAEADGHIDRRQTKTLADLHRLLYE